jgi:hypothetical protein
MKNTSLILPQRSIPEKRRPNDTIKIVLAKGFVKAYLHLRRVREGVWGRTHCADLHQRQGQLSMIGHENYFSIGNHSMLRHKVTCYQQYKTRTSIVSRFLFSSFAALKLKSEPFSNQFSPCVFYF